MELLGPPEPLPAHVSVTIIGGGVMGVSTAWHLARGGVGSILVIERNLLGPQSWRSRWVGSGQRSRIQATFRRRNAAS